MTLQNSAASRLDQHDSSGPEQGAGKRPTLTSLSLAALFNCTTGYGSMGEYLALGMAQAGVQVNCIPLRLRREGLTEEFQQLLARSQPEQGEPVLFFHWLLSGYPILDAFRASQNIFLYTTWEADRLPVEWTRQINQTRAVIVPTRFTARVCQASDVSVPVEVVPQGIDPQVYSYQERPARAGLTTLMVGPVHGRKHVLEGIAAWKRVFVHDPNARLILKANYGKQDYTPDDPRIHTIYTNELTRGITHWYQQADVFMALGNEGFGLPLVEGMATGLPVIALHSEGQSDLCEDAQGLLLPISPKRFEPYDASQFGCGSGGRCGIPDVEEIAQCLDWVNRHRDEARVMGQLASQWVLKNRNVWTMGPAVLATMQRLLQ